MIISEFGESFLESKKRTRDLYTPILLLPLESLFFEPVGPAIDIWILGDYYLFEGFFSGKDDILAEMISLLEPLPGKMAAAMAEERGRLGG